MSQPPNDPRRRSQQPQQRPPQQPGYPPQQQGYSQQPGYPPQQQGYSQQPGYPPQQPAPQRPIIMVQQPSTNPVVRALQMLWYPFGKFFGFIAALINTIIHEMLRSVVRFVIGIILMLVLLAAGFLFVSALLESGFDLTQVLPLMVEQVTRIFGTGS